MVTCSKHKSELKPKILAKKKEIEGKINLKNRVSDTRKRRKDK